MRFYFVLVLELIFADGTAFIFADKVILFAHT